MKIRIILFLLTAFLGAALLATVALQIREALQRYEEAIDVLASGDARALLSDAAGALGAERFASHQVLTGATDPEGTRLAQRRAEVDSLLASIPALLEEMAPVNTHSAAEQRLAFVSDRLRHLRQQLDTRPQKIDPSAWFAAATASVERLGALRLALLREQVFQASATRVEAQLRSHLGLLREALSQNRALLANIYRASPRQPSPRALPIARANLGRAATVVDLMRELLDPTVLSPPLVRQGERLITAYLTTTAPWQQALATGSRGPAADAERAGLAADTMIGEIDDYLHALQDASRQRLRFEARAATWEVGTWAALLLLGMVAVATSLLVVRIYVVRPLETLTAATLRLAEDDVDAELPAIRRSHELTRMADALRVFRANALRRRQLERDHHAIHARLREAHRQLRSDLDAAASIQVSLLPPAGRHGSIGHVGLYRPSAVIAGDTYNVIEAAGCVRFFQIDVAGHGAAAALVSVAAHHAMSQALGRDEPDRLEAVLERINLAWPEGLPYFTCVAGEIDTRTGQACIVQAGHPPPLLTAPDGTVREIGDGGFPVGLVDVARYDRLDFALAPGERLIVYSDGVTDAANPRAERFSEDRLAALASSQAGAAPGEFIAALEAELLRWQEGDRFEDDVSVLVLDWMPEKEDHAAG